MNILEIIDKKRLNKKLTTGEINYFIRNYVTTGKIKDYQASALLMAICINGMDSDEILALCNAMLQSGEIVDLSFIDGTTVDKHSSGGVSDTTSLALIPILACADLTSVKMSGRSLGFTGGTIDKLEAFEGINLERSQDEIKEIVKKCGCVIVSQTKNLVPADKKLYALRDATSTIQSIPLIAASIMSKKLASNNDIIFLDIKIGEGAFVERYEDAQKLAFLMREIGFYFGKSVATLISDMNEPLGNGIGCCLEVLDAIDALEGKPSRLFNLVKIMAVKIMEISFCYTKEEAEEKFNSIIETRQGYNKFIEMIALLGGNEKSIETMRMLKPTSTLVATTDGFISQIKAKELGLLVCQMGGGRQELDDKINHEVGVKILKHTGDRILKGEPIAEIYNTNEKLSDAEILRKLGKLITLSDSPCKPIPLIKEYKYNNC